MTVFGNLLQKLNGPVIGIKSIVNLYARGGLMICTPDIESPLVKTVIQPDGDVNTLLRSAQVDEKDVNWEEHMEKLDSVIRSIRQLRSGLRWLSLVSLAFPLVWEIYNIATEQMLWEWSLRYLVAPLGFLVLQIMGRLIVFWIKHKIGQAGKRFLNEEWQPSQTMADIGS